MVLASQQVEIMLLSKEFVFDAAHNLIHYHGKCEKLHGHTYRLKVVLEGQPDSEGMIMDFIDLSRIVKELVISQLDHAYINYGYGTNLTIIYAEITAICTRFTYGRLLQVVLFLTSMILRKEVVCCEKVSIVRSFL